MAAKDVRFGDSARARMVAGVNILADAVNFLLAIHLTVNNNVTVNRRIANSGKLRGNSGVAFLHFFGNWLFRIAVFGAGGSALVAQTHPALVIGVLGRRHELPGTAGLQGAALFPGAGLLIVKTGAALRRLTACALNLAARGRIKEIAHGG